MNDYRTKQYESAATKFIQILEKDPENATAAYYASYALYGAGKQTEAVNMFWYLCKHCSSSREAYTARSFLRSLDKTYVKDSTDPKIGVLPAAKHESMPLTQSNTKAMKESIIAAMVVVTPRRSALDVTPEFVESIRNALRDYPLHILRFLHEHKCKMIISPNVIENDFRMQNRHPRGYSEDSKMDNVPALFNGTDIVIGQYLKDQKGDTIPNVGIIGTIRHETGHAIDRYLGGISRKEEFRHEFLFDGNCADREKLAYFVNSPSETFAELACQRLGGRTDDYRSERCELLNQYYPRCGKLVDKALAQLR